MGDRKALFLVCSVLAVSILLLSSVSAFSFGDWFKSIFGSNDKITGNVVGSGDVGGSGSVPSTEGYIKAIVYNSKGELITNAQVILISSSGVEYAGVWDGRYLYAFGVPVGNYNLRVVATGYEVYNHPGGISVLSGPNNGPIVTLSSLSNSESSSSSGGAGGLSSSSSSSSSGGGSVSPIISYSFDSSSDKLRDGASIVDMGVGGKSAKLDGVNDYVLSDEVSVNGQVSVMGWFKTNGLKSGNNEITGTWISNRDSGVILDPEMDGSVKMYVNLRGLGWYSTSSPANSISLNEWQHWAGTYDGFSIRLYKNGELVATKLVTGILGGEGAFCVGKDCGISNRFFDGSVDEVKVYASVASAGKISEIYNGENGKLVEVTSGGNDDSCLDYYLDITDVSSYQDNILVSYDSQGLSNSDLKFSLRKFGSRLQGHPDFKCPGVEFCGGSLGLGLSFSIGNALSAKIDGKNHHIYTIIGDGECDEGQVWEAAMTAAKYKIDNMTVILDRNFIQQDDYTERVMPLDEELIGDDLSEMWKDASRWKTGDKWRSFGWNVIEIDGHRIEQIDDAITRAKKAKVFLL